MKKILTLLTTLAGVLILLAPNAAHARQQQVATFDARDDAPRLAARNAVRTSAEESRARATALEKRKAALQKYLASVEPASADYEAASRSIREIDVKLRDIAAAAEAEAARPLPVRFARQMEGVSAEDSPASKLLSISPGDRRSRFKSEVRIKVSPSFNSNIKITVVNNTGEEVYNNTLRYLVRGVDDYTTTVTLGEGVNIVKASSTDDKVVSNALLISGGELPADTAAKAERTVNAAPKAFRRQTGQEGLVGLLLGGVVVSQQADRFSQADPFMGFIVGFSGRPNDKTSRALHFRVKGIFQVQPKKDEAPPKDIAAVDPTDFTPFLASRKSFDIEMHGWWDTRLFKRTPRVRVGLYGAVGGTTYLAKNELLGDETVEVEEKDAEGNETGGETELDPELAKVDNDINLYYEGGLIGHFFGDEDNKKLFMQAILAYGNYEGLAGLNPPGDGFWGNSRNRFVGKLRVFPTYLNVSAEGDAEQFSPMFGVELNAGRGPDQLKFFTGVAVSISAFKKLGP